MYTRNTDESALLTLNVAICDNCRKQHKVIVKDGAGWLIANKESLAVVDESRYVLAKCTHISTFLSCFRHPIKIRVSLRVGSHYDISRSRKQMKGQKSSVKHVTSDIDLGIARSIRPSIS